MKTPRLAPVCALLMMFGLTACPQTTVPRNFGGKPLALKPDEWQGTWRIAGEDDDLRFVVKDASAGEIAVLETDEEKKKDKDEPIQLVIHETGTQEGKERAFMIILSETAGKSGSLNLITMPENGVFHMWNLRDEAVAAAVKNGELKGVIEEVKEKGEQKPSTHTNLNADPVNYEKLMDPKFWEWSKPATMVRKQEK